ncbi:unnamed protein product, partial [Onchocerca flexuosa]|uniref:Homeobox protein 2-like n=1 Tax=Onchocerca flexuosa TaxID=387005 RepID=A0A183HL76_9BILA
MTDGRILSLDFNISHQIVLKKTRFGGGSRTVKFSRNDNGSDSMQLLSKGKILFVSIGPGLPNNTRPNGERIIVKQHHEKRKMPFVANQVSPSSQHITTSNRVYPVKKNNNNNNNSMDINRNSGIVPVQKSYYWYKSRLFQKAANRLEKPKPPLKPKSLPLVEALYS